MAHKHDYFQSPRDGTRCERQRGLARRTEKARAAGTGRGGGGRAGRFCARRGIHTVRFGSTDYAHSSLTEGTSINVAQEHGAICLGRENQPLQHRETARLTADARGRISRDPVVRTPFHLH